MELQYTGKPPAVVRDGALLGGACFVAALAMLIGAGVLDARPWIANALLLAVMLRRRQGDTIWLLCAGLLADGSARFLSGAPPGLAAALAAADMLEVGIAWYGLCRLYRDDSVPRYIRPLMFGPAALLAALVGALLAALAQHALTDTPVLPAHIAQWWLGHAMGLLAVTPVVLHWDKDQLRRLGGGERSVRFGLFALSTLAVAAMAGLSLAALPLLLAVLVLAACRMGVLGTALLNLMAALAVVIAVSVQAPATSIPGAIGIPLALGFAVALASLAPLLVSILIQALGKEREQAMQDSDLANRRLQMVVDHSPALIAQLDRDLRYRFVNRSWLQWHGLREEEVVGRALPGLFEQVQPCRTTGSIATRISRVMSGQAQKFESQMSDGRKLRMSYEPEFAADGAVQGFYMLGEDMSWRDNAQLRFDALLTASEALLLLDVDGRVVQANDAAAALFATRREDLLQAETTQLFTAASAALLCEALPRLRRSEPAQSDTLTLQGQRKDGEFALELRLSAIPGDGRTPYAAALRDVSEQRHLSAALQHSQALAQVTLDAVGDAVVACDAQQRITVFNPVAETLSGWSCADALGRPVAQVLRMFDRDSSTDARSPLSQAVDGNRPTTLQPDLALLRRNGAHLPIEASAMPMHDAQDKLVGGVMVFHDVSETQAMAKKMSHLAQHDFLTDLPNRVLLHDRLAQALAACEAGSKGALLFVDLDFFKNINDTLGHQAGDKVLQEVAKRLVKLVRADDTVSRQGGDEFVLLLVRLSDPTDVARIAEKLIAEIERPFFIEGQELRLSASIGIALFPQDGHDIETLMKQADTALYHAKEAGRGRYSYFTAIMSDRAEQRMRMEHDLRFALANEDFFLVYQPKVLVPEGRVIGMEALVRWRRSDSGEVMLPDDFIPVAEETGLMVALDEWVMHEACRQNRAWQDAGLAALPMSVNVSMARFDPERLVRGVRKTLAETGMEPQYLEIEFTESQMFTHLEHAQQLIAELKRIGVQVAIDDFGTGYSSLSYLVRYKFDALKIDRSFVQGLPDDPKHTAIIEGMIGMAHALDYRVVAEGVENVAQAHALQRLGCREIQGFLYGGPVPADEFEAILRAGKIVLTQGCKALRSA